MYEVLLDGKTIYYPSDEKLCLESAILEQKVGESGSFTFVAPFYNPIAKNIEERKEIVIKRDGFEFWRGDIREKRKGFNKSVEVFCVGDMSWLGEYIVDAHSIETTYDAYFRNLLNQYNNTVDEKKRFSVGTIALSGIKLFKYETMSLLEIFRDIAGSNYYVRVRRAKNGNQIARYIDIVKMISYGKNCRQEIHFGENMMDYVEESNTSWLLTAILPQGAELETETIEGIRDKVDISSENEGSKVLVNETAKKRYGYIEKTINFSNTTNPSTLKTQAENYLKQNSQPRYTFKIKAVDLHDVFGVEDSFDIGDTIHVEAKPYDVSQNVSLCEKSTNLLDLSDNILILSSTISRRNFTDNISDIEIELTNKIPSIVDIKTASKLQALELLKNSDGGNISYEFDSEGRIIAQHIADNADLSKATRDWVWNINGLGYRYRQSTSNDWTDLGLAMTADGKFVADFIATGTMSANRVRTGVISSQNYVRGDDEWFTEKGITIDLNNGNILAPSFAFWTKYGAKFKGTVEASDVVGSTITGSTITGSSFVQENGKNKVKIRDGKIICENAWISVQADDTDDIQLALGARKSACRRGSEGYHMELDSKWILEAAKKAQDGSDKRLKKQIENIPIELSKSIISRINPVSFYYIQKDDEMKQGKRYGVIAQDLREILDDLGESDAYIEHSRYEPDKTRTVEYRDFIAHILNVLKYQQIEIEKLMKGKNTNER